MPWELTNMILSAPAFTCDFSSGLLTCIIDLHISAVWLHKILLGYHMLLTVYPFLSLLK